MRPRRVAAIILVIIAAAMVIVALRGFLDDDSDSSPTSPSPSNEADKGPQRHTDYVEQGIAERLTQRSGKQTDVTCPEAVSAKVGTKFTCKIRYAGDDEVVSKAKVKIDGKDGHYTWDANPLKDSGPNND